MFLEYPLGLKSNFSNYILALFYKKKERTFGNFWKMIILYMYKMLPAVCKECSLLFENYITDKMCANKGIDFSCHMSML